MKAEQIILSRGVPKTGQTHGYDSWDDGYFEAGWWIGRKAVNNKIRFIAKTLEGDDVVIDRATGLMWAADYNEAGCNNGDSDNWSNFLTYVSTLTFAGFSDWRMPNVNELLSIMNHGANNPAIYTDFFKNFSTGNFFTSTTCDYKTTYVYYVAIEEGWTWEYGKTSIGKVIVVRGGL